MILQRLATAILEQNWFTVVLEILIVVVGIFIGLQVDDWNESRKQNRQELAYVNLLLDDSTVMHQQALAMIERRKNSLLRMKQAMRALEECNSSPDSVSDVEFALTTYQQAPGINYVGATYEEMVATGALARIADSNLKRSISDAFSALENLSGRLTSFRVSIPVVDEILWNNVEFSLGVDPGTTTAAFDFLEICRNTAFRNTFVEIYDIQWDGMRAGENVLFLLEDLIVRLREYDSQVES
jgi:hypothetical protein